MMCFKNVRCFKNMRLTSCRFKNYKFCRIYFDSTQIAEDYKYLSPGVMTPIRMQEEGWEVFGTPCSFESQHKILTAMTFRKRIKISKK